METIGIECQKTLLDQSHDPQKLVLFIIKKTLYKMDKFSPKEKNIISSPNRIVVSYESINPDPNQQHHTPISNWPR
ncbi:unnamed protein product [Dovyalis caffra]|uniref:Uncharacterized protein n=1 Tax=Dovyalis caffra TaxID=77055 RepID=A0AAV1QT02_9ROSI|nr:unnamed protein product [Dovyalis caffra]